MRGTGGADEGVVGLQEKIPVAGFSDAFVDDSGSSL